LGDFSNAFKSGQKAKQTEIERAQQKESAEMEKVHKGIEAARGWVTNVLAPVVAEAAQDVASDGKIVMQDNSNPPKISNHITIAMNGKPTTQLTFIVDENGAINSYRDGSQGHTMGSITTVNQVQVRQLFLQTLQAVGRA
jgi:hypothetical protein